MIFYAFCYRVFLSLVENGSFVYFMIRNKLVISEVLTAVSINITVL